MIEPADIEILADFIAQMRQQSHPVMAPGDIVLRAGRYFLGTPYTAHSLEAPGPETLVVNLRAFDCFTLVESCCALTLLIHQDSQPSLEKEGRFPVPALDNPGERHQKSKLALPPDRSSGDIAAAFAALLQRFRYRDGVIAGYPSRLHYFSDWLADNARKGLLRDITAALGGRSAPKVIDFMTKHRELYLPLSDDDTYHRLKAVEMRLSALPRHVLPKEEIAIWEEKIAPGDILAVATHEEGLDVAHAGLAIRRAGRLHLLHASAATGRVIVSPETLAAYLQGQENRAGIIAARLC